MGGSFCGDVMVADFRETIRIQNSMPDGDLRSQSLDSVTDAPNTSRVPKPARYSISPATAAALNQLTPGKAVEIFTAIGRSGDLGALPDLLAHVMDRKTGYAELAAEALHQLVRDTEDLMTLERYLRGSHRIYCLGSAWSALRPHAFFPGFSKTLPDVHSLMKFGPSSVSLLAMASFHRSGHIREQAVKLLDTIHTGEELRYLLIRANDWVHEVRQAALNALTQRINSEYTLYFVKELPLIRRMERWQRNDLGALCGSILMQFKAPQAWPALQAGMAATSTAIRRASFALGYETSGDSLEQFIPAGLKDRDPLIRRRSLDAAARLPAPRLRALLLPLARERDPKTRCERLDLVARRLPEQAEGILRKALLDGHPSVRAIARFQLGKSGMTDFAGYYRGLLDAPDGAPRRIVIDGLGETGSASDSDRLLDIFRNSRGLERVAALCAMAKLDFERHRELFMDALLGDDPVTARAALKIYRSRPRALSPKILGELFLRQDRPALRLAAVTLLGEAAKWDAIPWLLLAAHDPVPEVAARGRRHLENWHLFYNRSFLTPTLEQRKALDEALNSAMPIISIKDKARMADILAGLDQRQSGDKR